MIDRVDCVIIEAPKDCAERLGEVLFEAGATGIEEQEGTERVTLIVYAGSATEAHQLLRAAAPGLARVRHLAGGQPVEAWVTTRPGHDWQHAWARALRPAELTERFLVVPAGLEETPPPGMEAIVLEPVLAFGFGEHATTRLAARAVEQYVTAHPDATVLDVGTGSGVLSIVAARCGARRVVGLDCDALAVEAARRHAVRNDASSCVFSTKPVGEWKESFELVVANLDLPTLLHLAGVLTERAAPDGRLLVTGLLEEQTAAVAEPFQAAGWQEARRAQEEDWVLLELALTEGAE